MPDVTCTGGAVLTVRPVPVRARDGVPYEVTLELLLDGAPFGQVGERCGGLLADAAHRLGAVVPVSTPAADVAAAARRLRGPVPVAPLEADGDAVARLHADVPVSTLEAVVVAAGGDWSALAPHLPRDRELFALRARDPDDVPCAGALRALLDVVRTWTGRTWSTRVQVRLEAWGDDGRGVSALLDLEQARALVDGVLGEAAGDGGGPLTTL